MDLIPIYWQLEGIFALAEALSVMLLDLELQRVDALGP